MASTCEILIDAIEGFTFGSGIHEDFVGVILLPIAGAPSPPPHFTYLLLFSLPQHAIAPSLRPVPFLDDRTSGNAAEHYSALTASFKNKMNLAIGIAVGSRCALGTRI